MASATNEYKEASQNENTLVSNLDNTLNEYLNGKIEENPGENPEEPKDPEEPEEKTTVEVSIPYIGTSSCTINANVTDIEESIVEYIIYLNGSEYKTITEVPYTIEGLDPETAYNIEIEAKTINDEKFKSNTQIVETKERVYLFKDGDECTELTGGWKGVGVTDIKSNSGSSYQAIVPSITKNAQNGYIYTKYANARLCCGALSITNKIDLTQYKKLIVDTSATARYGSWYRILVTTDNTKYYNNLILKAIAYAANKSDIITVNRDIFTIDITNINQEAYVVFNYCNSMNSSSYWVDSYLYNAWLEY